ncbi:MAG: tetratricopeptide repeat protein [Myxococcales bacterium]|nr:tetratricopeptide repeat protein [Myxococcales bacterium]
MRLALIGRALLVVAVINLGFGAALSRAWAVSARNKRLAKREYMLGKQAFDLAKFREALGHYERAYQLSKLPGFFFNIGQCYRNLDEYGKAIFAFQQFLKYKGRSGRAPAVRKLIRQLERKEEARKKRLAEEAKRKAAAEERRRRLAQQQANQTNNGGNATVIGDDPRVNNGDNRGTGDVGDGDGSGSGVDLRPVPPIRRRRRGSAPIYKKWWFWTLIVAAVGGGVAGVYAGVRAGGSSLPDSDFLGNFSR